MHPSHRTIRGNYLALLLFAAAAGAAESGTPKITVEALAPSVYLLTSPDAGNIVVSVGDDGAVMVDDQEASAAKEMVAALKTVSSKPLRFVINTHTHADHTGGNEFFRKLAPIIAHRNVRTRMMAGPDKRPTEAWPNVDLEGELVLHLNGEDIRVLALPAGHTDGDVVVFFKKSNVVHMGDVFIAPAASFVDISNGGTLLGLIQNLEFLIPQIPPDAKVVPGHGPVSSRADVSRGLEILKEMKSIVESGIAAGKTMDQIVADKPFEKWRGLLAISVPTNAYISVFYRELAARQ